MATLQTHKMQATVVWPAQVGLTASTTFITVASLEYKISLAYPSTINISPLPPVPNGGWTLVTIGWQQPFNGTKKAMAASYHTADGQRKLLETVERVQNDFIDRLYLLPSTERVKLSRIRHFGVRDWIHLEINAGAHRLFSLVGGYISQQLISTPVNTVKAISKNKNISSEDRNLCRAADLSEFGYATESLLLAFSVLDAAVQKFLVACMKTKGISEEAANAVLRNTTTKRLATYLGPILKLSTGTSLEETNSKLYSSLLKLNGLRNDAIHNGLSVDRNLAIQACTDVRATLHFLTGLRSGILDCRADIVFSGNP